MAPFRSLYCDRCLLLDGDAFGRTCCRCREIDRAERMDRLVTATAAPRMRREIGARLAGSRMVTPVGRLPADCFARDATRGDVPLHRQAPRGHPDWRQPEGSPMPVSLQGMDRQRIADIARDPESASPLDRYRARRAAIVMLLPHRVDALTSQERIALEAAHHRLKIFEQHVAHLAKGQEAYQSAATVVIGATAGALASTVATAAVGPLPPDDGALLFFGIAIAALFGMIWLWRVRSRVRPDPHDEPYGDVAGRPE